MVAAVLSALPEQNRLFPGDEVLSALPERNSRTTTDGEALVLLTAKLSEREIT